MAEWSTVTGDLRCRCSYNLRGLAFAGRCPECGRPVSESVRYYIHEEPKTPEQAEALQKRNTALRHAAAGTPYPIAAVLLVHRAFTLVKLRSGQPNATAADLCDAFRDYARSNLGRPAKATLQLAEWNIRRSEDVGAIVFRLVAVDLLRAEPGDSPERFAGLFTLETLYAGEIDDTAALAAALRREQSAGPPLLRVLTSWLRLMDRLFLPRPKWPRRPS